MRAESLTCSNFGCETLQKKSKISFEEELEENPADKDSAKDSSKF